MTDSTLEEMLFPSEYSGVFSSTSPVLGNHDSGGMEISEYMVFYVP